MENSDKSCGLIKVFICLAGLPYWEPVNFDKEWYENTTTEEVAAGLMRDYQEAVKIDFHLYHNLAQGDPGHLRWEKREGKWHEVMVSGNLDISDFINPAELTEILEKLQK